MTLRRTWNKAPLALRGAAACATALALALACAPGRAHAETLEDLQNKAIEANRIFEDAQTRAREAEDSVRANEARIAQLQGTLPERRDRAKAAIRASYKLSQMQGDLLLLLLSSEDFNKFLTQAVYLDAISQSNAAAVSDLTNSIKELENARAVLSQQAEAARRATDEAAAEKAKAEAAKSVAEAMAKSGSEEAQARWEAGEIDDATLATIEATSAQVASGEYSFVAASTYGEGDGFMYGTTASGDIVTPTSMGVAMRSMPLGTIIEITYEGTTVRAVVNDRGPYVGDRQIDLQPAVAHALGFSGVGMLGYRVVN